MDNPFDLYTGKEYNKNNIKCTKELKKVWKNFKTEIFKTQNKFKMVGASDTASKEEFSKWISKKTLNGDLM